MFLFDKNREIVILGVAENSSYTNFKKSYMTANYLSGPWFSGYIQG